MTKILAWAALLTVGAALVGSGVFLGVTRLDDADKWGSVISALATVLGLAMTVYGVVLARREGPTDGQSVTGSVTGGGVTQVRGVRGNVRIGGGASPARAAASSPVAPTETGRGGSGGQSVMGSWTAGGVRQVDDVHGDAYIDR